MKNILIAMLMLFTSTNLVYAGWEFKKEHRSGQETWSVEYTDKKSSYFSVILYCHRATVDFWIEGEVANPDEIGLAFSMERVPLQTNLEPQWFDVKHYDGVLWTSLDIQKQDFNNVIKNMRRYWTMYVTFPQTETFEVDLDGFAQEYAKFPNKCSPENIS